MAPTRTRCAFVHTKQRPDRLRVGYLSPDFRRHPVGILLHELFARHDREAFEVYAYALVPADDEYTHRIREGCDAFVDVSLMSPEQAARRIHADGVHLLIDLGGYTAHTRTAILALEPAPVQAHFLGYPNTMGADFVPYLLADAWIVPEALAPYYTEQIVYLPQAFVGSPLEMAEAPVTRAAFGLPADAVVFCCFNARYKIEPTVFDAWMRILRRVPESVLWLSGGPARRGGRTDPLCRTAALAAVPGALPAGRPGAGHVRLQCRLDGGVGAVGGRTAADARRADQCRAHGCQHLCRCRAAGNDL